MKQTSYSVGIYCRLSRDDGNEGDSSSIQSQKYMLTEYVNAQGWSIVSTYIDDGFSGTNFQRPDFQRMINDIEDGKVNLVITKDLSRLGRNYILCGQYTEMYFPSKGVRFIALNDAFDTQNENNDIAPFKNILNDMVAKDTSRKVKSGKRAKAQSGQFINPAYPYGYTKTADNKNRLVIDEAAAAVVKRIFDLYVQGKAMLEICRVLMSEKILKPSAYKKSYGHKQFLNYPEGATENSKYNWSNESIRRILLDQTYLGHTVSFKCGTISYKDRRKVAVPKEDWLIVKNTHEPIIDSDTWDIAQNLLKTKRRPLTQNPLAVNEFACIVKCADCGTTLKHRTSVRKNKTKPDVVKRVYSCSGYDSQAVAECSPHRICHEVLHEIVLHSIHKYATLAAEDKVQMAELLDKSGKQNQTYEVTLCRSELVTGQKRLVQLEQLITHLYENHVEGKINEANFAMLMKKYQDEQSELTAHIPELKRIIAVSEQAQNNSVQFMELIESYTTITALTPDIVSQLIDRIMVHEAEVIDGVKTQQIDIYWRLIGKID